MTQPSGNVTSQYPHLENAPIVEALLDIQVQLPEGKTIDELHVVFDKIKGKFPIEKKRYQFSSSIEFKPLEKVTEQGISTSHTDGYLFHSENKTKVFQARLDGFTFNKHKPYENWTALKKEAQELWDIYRDAAEPVSIKRLALRFINKIPLKAPFDPSNYFRTLPSLAPDLDYGIFNLFSQISIKNKKIDAVANITEALETTDSEFVNFVFDIDAFRFGDFKEADIWNLFDELRDFKNEIFFKSLTPATLKLLG